MMVLYNIIMRYGDTLALLTYDSLRSSHKDVHAYAVTAFQSNSS